jgi:hypothetical protein
MLAEDDWGALVALVFAFLKLFIMYVITSIYFLQSQGASQGCDVFSSLPGAWRRLLFH